MAFRSILRRRLGALAACTTGAVSVPALRREQHDAPQAVRAPVLAATSQVRFARCEVERNLSRKSTHSIKESSHMKEIASKVNMKSMLQKSKTFGSLEDEALDAVVSVAKPMWLKKGTAIVEQGRENSTMFIVCHGTLAASVDDDVVSALEAGSLVGEWSAVRASTAKATVQVTSSMCYVAAVSREALEQALDEDSWALLDWLVDERSKEHLTMNFLRTVPIFADASEDFFKSASKQLSYQSFPAGTTLFTAGESDDKGMFVIRSGEIEAHITKEVFKTLGPLTVIGEIMLVSPNAVRTATVITKTDVDLLQMRRSDFMQLLTKYPKDMLPLRKVARSALKKTSSSVRVVAE